MANSPPIIRELSENVIHKIAAGEVVERPVSVVKELLENSLDAQSDRIELNVEQGGMKTIEVIDNGHGIEANQLPLALKRHATSKILQAEDLFALTTLGFRGEALPAIASVSHFILESATENSQPVGYVWEINQSEPPHLKETARTQGTRIRVGDLFCTTPARRKFLKRPETEWSHISDLVTALALSRLDVSWRVTHNGKVFMDSPATSDPKERILDLFGREAMENLFAVERQVAEVGIWGLIGHPNFSRRSNRQMFVYVNGRYVQDRLINHGIVQGYRSLLMTGQYPMVLLHLNLAPELVDVNVHPTKREVKFSNGNAIHHLISETIAQALAQAPWQQSVQDNVPQDFDNRFSKESFSGGMPTSHPTQASQNFMQGTLNGTLDPSARIQGALRDYYSQHLPAAVNQGPVQVKMGSFGFSSLRLIGQFNLTYLVCEQDGALVLIDQHAAHERIGFEQLKKSFSENGLPRQRLLTPLTLEFSPNESEKLRGRLKELDLYGIEIDDFGGNTFALKAHPTLLNKCDWIKLLRDMVDHIESPQETQELSAHIDHVLATMACHRQIRAGDRLSVEEMRELLVHLEGTPRSYHCPHGRPVMVEIADREIEKWFKRIL